MAAQKSNTKFPDTNVDTPTSGRLRWRRIIPAAMLLLAIAVWLAPAILARTNLRHHVVGYLFPAYTGTASIGSANLGWTSPVILRDLTGIDANGRQWLTISELHSSKTLWSLLFGDAPDLGTFTLIDPKLSIQLREDGSDFEDRLWEILASDGTGEPTAVTIEIQQGTASWISPAGEEIPGGLEQLDATIHQAADQPWPAPVTIAATVTDGEHNGTLNLQINESASQKPADPLSASLATKNLPLAPLSPWLRRFGLDISAAGTISSDLVVSAPPASIFPISAHGKVEGQRLRITLPYAADPIVVEHATLRGKITHDGKRIAFEKVTVQSEAARLELGGAIDPTALTSTADWKQRLLAILDQDLNLTGTVDLARLPAVLPLPKLSGKSLESGRLRFSLKTEGENAIRRGIVNVTTSDLVASLPDRQVTWDAPFAMNVVLKQDQGGLSAEKLNVTSDFVTLDGSIAGGTGKVAFNVNLDKFREQLSQILAININEDALAGRASGTCQVKQGDKPDTFNITTKAELAGLTATWAGQRWTANGTLDAAARLIHAATSTKIENLKGSIKNLDASNGSLTIDEPHISFNGNLVYAAGNGISSKDLRIECDTIDIHATNLVLPLAGSEPLQFDGTIRGDLGELARHVIPGSLGLWPSGDVAGSVHLLHGASNSSVNAQLKVEKPALNRRVVVARETNWQPVWSDNSATLNFEGQYAAASDELTIKNAHWKSQGAAVDLTGKINEANTRAVTSLNGRLTYDLTTLRSHFPDLSIKEVAVAGQGTREFSLQGPLRSQTAILDPALQANASLGWQKLVLWGLPLAQGDIKADLRNSRLSLATSQIPMAGGTAGVSGDIAIAPPLTMAINKGRIVNNAQLTPEMCRTWLAYATPLLADVTEVRGTMSLDLAEGAVPLLNPAGTRARATLAIQNIIAQPGPTARAILKTVQQIQQIAGGDPTRGTDLRMTAPAQKIQVTVANGRVHHDRFLVRLGDADGPTVQTSGSVGFDETLNLVAEIPLDRGWFRDERVAAALGGQLLRIPITGTLSQPVPDPRALQEFARRAAAGAVKNILQEQLGDDPLRKLLDR